MAALKLSTRPPPRYQTTRSGHHMIRDHIERPEGVDQPSVIPRPRWHFSVATAGPSEGPTRREHSMMRKLMYAHHIVDLDACLPIVSATAR